MYRFESDPYQPASSGGHQYMNPNMLMLWGLVIQMVTITIGIFVAFEVAGIKLMNILLTLGVVAGFLLFSLQSAFTPYVRMLQVLYYDKIREKDIIRMTNGLRALVIGYDALTVYALQLKDDKDKAVSHTDIAMIPLSAITDGLYIVERKNVSGKVV